MKILMPIHEVRHREALRTCQRAGVAFEITDRSTDWRLVRDLLSLCSIALFVMFVLTAGAVLSGG